VLTTYSNEVVTVCDADNFAVFRGRAVNKSVARTVRTRGLSSDAKGQVQLRSDVPIDRFYSLLYVLWLLFCEVERMRLGCSFLWLVTGW